MAFPAQFPVTAFTLLPSNTVANIADLPVWRAPRAGGVAYAKAWIGANITGNDTNYVNVAVHKEGNTTHTYAALNIATGTNVVASWIDIPATSRVWDAGESVALSVTFGAQGDQNFGTSKVMYQVDWLPASHPRGGD